MISFRRSLSPSIHDRSTQNGTALLGSNHLLTTSVPGSTASLPTTISPIAGADLSSPNDKSQWHMSCFGFLHRRETFDRSKLKGAVWKKPFLPVMFCFVFGFLVGLMPFPSQKSIASRSEAGQQDFSLEVKGFTTNLQHQLSNDGDKGRNAEGVSGRFVAEKNSSSITLSSTVLAQVAASSHLLEPGFGKLLIVVTPTYNRPFQALYLTRLSHTLKLVPPPLLWLVVEMQTQSLETATILRKTGVMYRHLVCKKNMTDVKDRGVHQRNSALAHIEQHQLDGIVYFADDDNVYSLELFEQMRLIKRFGTWPVAMLTHSKSKAILEGPVCDVHTVIGWHTNEKSKRLRRFHVDMSGFAFNSTILWDPQRWSRPTTEPIRQLDTIKEGFQETTFIEQLVEDEGQMEGLPSGCAKVMVWHLHLEAPTDMVYPRGWTVQQSLNATRDS